MTLGELLAPQPWEPDALCAEPEHEALPWFPTVGQDPEPAKEVCRRCLVQDECREFAIGAQVDAGVWGGETAVALRKIRLDRQRSRQAR